MEQPLKVSVIGAGYVGLVTGGCLAGLGHEVVCTDNDVEKLKTLESGRLPIYEPGLDVVIAEARKEGRLSFRANMADAVRAGDAIFICVGTPPLPNGSADLSAIDHVARLVATEARSPKLVVEKSTVPAQTGQELKRALGVYGRKSGVKFSVASNPEFLREGTAVEDFLHPDRIVIGVEDDGAARQLREIYRPVLERTFHCPIHAGKCPDTALPAWLVTTINSAELIKHASNSFLALKISYANMVADLAERLGADIDEVVRAVGMDARISTSFFRPGRHGTRQSHPARCGIREDRLRRRGWRRSTGHRHGVGAISQSRLEPHPRFDGSPADSGRSQPALAFRNEKPRL